jgi:hypothetical protein
MPYRHTQRGTFILVICAVTALFAAAFAVVTWGRADPTVGWSALIGPLAILAVVLGAAWYFSSMTVEVTDTELHWQLGWGGVSRIDRAAIESASIVRHPWWHGYGIRWLGPNRWTYIVSGRDTVEVRLKGGGWRRLGTDDPQGLLAALTSARR